MPETRNTRLKRSSHHAGYTMARPGYTSNGPVTPNLYGNHSTISGTLQYWRPTKLTMDRLTDDHLRHMAPDRERGGGRCNGLSPIKALGYPRPTPTPPNDYDIQTHPQVFRHTDQRSEHLIRRSGMRPRHKRTSTCALGMGRALACAPDRPTTRT